MKSFFIIYLLTVIQSIKTASALYGRLCGCYLIFLSFTLMTITANASTVKAANPVIGLKSMLRSQFSISSIFKNLTSFQQKKKSGDSHLKSDCLLLH